MNWIAKRFAELRIGEPATCGRLEVYPLIGPAATPIAYLTLDEALASSLLRVTEQGVDGRVDTVVVANDGSMPTLLLEGEELIGCRQNRVLNVSLLVAAKSILHVPVSCVEQGRWSEKSATFDTSANSQSSRGRASKVASVSASLAEGVGYRSDQGAVWAGIAERAEALRATSGTMAMSDVYEQASGRLADYEQCLPASSDALGAVFAINGSTTGVDFFDQPATWRKYAAKLLRGYALDALAAAPASPGAPQWAPADFFNRLAGECFESRPSLGLGSDLRADRPDLTAAALAVDDALVHFCAFPIHNEAGPAAALRSRVLRRRGGLAGTRASG